MNKTLLWDYRTNSTSKTRNIEAGKVNGNRKKNSRK